jgi:hypothetical protein
MSDPEEPCVAPAAAAFDAATLQKMATAQATGEAMLLTVAVSALAPLLSSLMSFSSSNSQRHHQAVSESAHASSTGLAAATMSVMRILQPPPATTQLQRDTSVSVEEKQDHPSWW